MRSPSAFYIGALYIFIVLKKGVLKVVALFFQLTSYCSVYPYKSHTFATFCDTTLASFTLTSVEQS